MSVTAPDGYDLFRPESYLDPTATRFDESPTDVQLAAYPDQEPFLSRTETYHAFVSGIGAGKTVAGIQRSLLNTHYWNIGETGMIVAPTVPALRNVIIPELRKWNVLANAEYKPSEKTLEFPNGSRVILESADNDRKIERLRGPSIAWFWMDEAATISPNAWKILIGRLRAGHYRNAAITTTPKGKNWVYDRFTDAGDVNQVFGVESGANPHLPEDYVGEIIEEYEGSFYEQEVNGRFVAFEGLVYPWFDEATHILDGSPSVETFDETIYGVDWGHNNPAAILAIGRRGEQYVVAEEFYERRCTVGDLADALGRLQDRWGTGRAYCDPSEPANIQTFRRKGFAATDAENAVTPGIQRVSSLRDELRIAPGCQNLTNEFGQYQYKDGDESEDPVKVNDHALDALRYALFTHSSTGGVASATVRLDGSDSSDTDDNTEDRDFSDSDIGQALEQIQRDMGGP